MSNGSWRSGIRRRNDEDERERRGVFISEGRWKWMGKDESHRKGRRSASEKEGMEKREMVTTERKEREKGEVRIRRCEKGRPSSSELCI